MSGRTDNAAPCGRRYKARELEGRNVSMLMPQPFSSRHTGYIQNYIASGVVAGLEAAGLGASRGRNKRAGRLLGACCRMAAGPSPGCCTQCVAGQSRVLDAQRDVIALHSSRQAPTPLGFGDQTGGGGGGALGCAEPHPASRSSPDPMRTPLPCLLCPLLTCSMRLHAGPCSPPASS